MPREQISLPRGTSIPNHLAVILDGNRRWARSRGLAPSEGHKAGAAALRHIIRTSRELGIHTLTVWGLSTENWRERPKAEVVKIVQLIIASIEDIRKEALENELRFVHLGRKDRLPKHLLKIIAKTEEETRHFTKHTLNVALDYGGRDEILRAVKKIVEAGVKPEDITEETFALYLDTGDQIYPYPDLFVRTSGEQRTSGFMPWQLDYAEYYWETGHLPDMTPEKLLEIIVDYSRRRRRFGGNDKETHLKFEPQVTAKLEVSWWRLSKIPSGMKLREYAAKHLKEQWGMSASLAKEAALLMVSAFVDGEDKKWKLAGQKMHKFYQLVKDEVKLAFEPSLAAKLQVSMWQKAQNPGTVSMAELDVTSRQLISEVYRISDLQAAKAAHLMSMATIERSLAKGGVTDPHWEKAEDYLEKYYSALKDRIA